jgi:hypothetical protein
MTVSQTGRDLQTLKSYTGYCDFRLFEGRQGHYHGRIIEVVVAYGFIMIIRVHRACRAIATVQRRFTFGQCIINLSYHQKSASSTILCNKTDVYS